MIESVKITLCENKVKLPYASLMVLFNKNLKLNFDFYTLKKSNQFEKCYFNTLKTLFP